ncbi:MAG: arginine--tRNA ligase [Synergistetes bacterium]|nr:arginine--tRNA ligase [Synergistota bacterium]MDW8191475.1 arginine--tRNA ligase [Synergistota bacterium]
MEEKIKGIILEALKKAILSLASEMGWDIKLLPEPELEKPRKPEFGDWATNIAMKIGSLFKVNPREVAERISQRLEVPKDILKGFEIAGPGFINFRFNFDWFKEFVREILRKDQDFGRLDLGKGKKVQVEFVSANPTGPLHVGHGRGAAVGDSLASILEFGGYEVEREYYINDAGLQMEILGNSVRSRYFELLGRSQEAPFPEDGYKGEYIYDIAREIIDKDGDKWLNVPEKESLTYFRNYACERILEGIKKDLEDFGVKYDVWFSEKSLYENGEVEAAIAYLRERGFIYEKDGALWFKSTLFGDEKDRVVVRYKGAPTYIYSDIAYHKNKYERGFDIVIDIWGADHHGYIPRMKAAVQALGRSSDSLQILLIQFVTLLRDGKPVSMSTRAGEFVTLAEVVAEVGKDAARYMFLTRKCDSHLEFDLELAKRQSEENPVYYVQYAHARICSLFEQAKERGIPIPDLSKVPLDLLVEPEEIELLKVLSEAEGEISIAVRELAPHRIPYYLQKLSAAFHSFYNRHPILSASQDLRNARLALSKAVGIVIRNFLSLIGVSAPERM